MKLAVHNIEGKDTKKKVDLSKSIFGIDPTTKGSCESSPSKNIP